VKQYIRYDPKNASTRIVRNCGPSGRHIVMSGEDRITSKQGRKTRKGAAAWLMQDDDGIEMGREPIFNPAQRETLVVRANGGSAKLYNPDGTGPGRKPVDPFSRRAQESDSEYIVRINAHIASM